MEQNFEKILERARRVSLSYDEKDSIRHRIKKTMGLNDALVFNPFRFLNLRFAAVALGVFVMLGTSVSFAAQDALPGHPLYAVKSFNEKLSGYLTASPEASAEWQVELADRRLEETEKLNSVGKLDENARASLEFRFETNANQFNKEIKTLRSENKLRRAGELTSQLESVMEKRKKILSDIASHESEEGGNSEIGVILLKVNVRSEQLMNERERIEQEIEKSGVLR